MNAGGLFDHERIDAELSGSLNQDDNSRDRVMRPFIELQFETPIMRALTGYRRSERREERSATGTTLDIINEYTARFGWTPAELPKFDLDFIRTEFHDEPLTIERQSDNYQLRSYYDYRNFRLNYDYTLTETESSDITGDPQNPLSESQTTNDYHSGSVRFSRRYLQDRVGLSGGLQGKLSEIGFFRRRRPDRSDWYSWSGHRQKGRPESAQQRAGTRFHPGLRRSADRFGGYSPTAQFRPRFRYRDRRRPIVSLFSRPGGSQERRFFLADLHS